MIYSKIAIFLTFVSLWISVYFTGPLQEIIAFLLIFSFGILHGSNDLKLVSKVSSSSQSFQVIAFIISYILTVVVASLLFYYLPIVALITFILFSAFHFGEQHWSSMLNNGSIINNFLFINYGVSLLFLLFYLNSAASMDVIYSLTEVTFHSDWFLWIFTISTFLWLVCAFILCFRKVITWQQLFFEVFMMLVFAIVFYKATLVWAFAIYFVFWHSIPSIHEQQLFLYGDISLKTFVQYLKSSFLIWFISILSMFLLYIWLREEAIFLSVFFAFLGAITFAHALTISKMFQLKH